MRLIFCLLMVCHGVLFSHQNQITEHNSDNKLRISLERLNINDHGIYVQMDGGGTIQVEAVYSDSQGLYVYDANSQIWKCPNCKFLNDVDRQYCRICYWPRP